MSNKDLNQTSNEDKNSENGKIFIKKEALRNMISHVLRFGHKTLEKSIEVMGICVGTYDSNEDKATLEKAIPVTHGDTVEVGFDKEDYELFSQLEKQYSGEIIGYYHSHPSWGLYLSESDKRNLQFFQNEKKQYGFGIVFDHTLMNKDGNFGFEIYRLDDYNNPETYHEVTYEIEIPTTLEYFKWVQKFMEDFHKKTPIFIKEIKEMKESIPVDLQEIPTSESEILREEELEKYSAVSGAISSFQNGITQFSEIFMSTLKSQIGKWVYDMEKGSSDGTEYLVESVHKLKESISSGFIKADDWFNRNMNSVINEFKESISKYVDGQVEDQKQLITDIALAKDNLISELTTYVEDNMKYMETEINNVSKSITDKITDTLQLSSSVEELVNKLDVSISSAEIELESLSQNIEKGVTKSISPFENNINEKIEKISSELQPLRDYFSEIHTLLEKLQKTITDFRNLT